MLLHEDEAAEEFAEGDEEGLVVQTLRRLPPDPIIKQFEGLRVVLLDDALLHEQQEAVEALIISMLGFSSAKATVNRHIVFLREYGQSI